jgi:hypothetical protein
MLQTITSLPFPFLTTFHLCHQILLSTDKVKLKFRLYFIYLLLILFKILCIFIVFVHDFMHKVLL